MMIDTKENIDSTNNSDNSTKNLEEIIKDEIVIYGKTKIHFVSKNDPPWSVENKEAFEEIKKFFGKHYNLFLKEENIDSISKYAFENLNKNINRSLKKCYNDTFLLLIIDDKGNSVFFQRYNENIIILKEVKKIYNYKKNKEFNKIQLGGIFKVTDFKKCKDSKGHLYLDETIKSKEFYDSENIHKARTKAIDYMKNIIDYYNLYKLNKKPSCNFNKSKLAKILNFDDIDKRSLETRNSPYKVMYFEE